MAAAKKAELGMPRFCGTCGDGDATLQKTQLKHILFCIALIIKSRQFLPSS